MNWCGRGGGKEKKIRNKVQFTQKYSCGVAFGSRFFFPVWVQGEADPVTPVVVPEEVLVHERHGGDDEAQQPERRQDHLEPEQQTSLNMEDAVKEELFCLMAHFNAHSCEKQPVVFESKMSHKPLDGFD